MVIKFVLPALLVAFALVPGQVDAQSAAPRQPAAQTMTPQQKAMIEGQNRQMVQGAQAVIELVDKNDAGDAWDSASDVAKRASSKRDFVRQIEADRKALGAVRSRSVRAITRSQSNGGKVPAGSYINVAFATQFAGQKAPIRELVSFHLDADQKWRLAGYTVH